MGIKEARPPPSNSCPRPSSTKLDKTRRHRWWWGARKRLSCLLIPKPCGPAANSPANHPATCSTEISPIQRPPSPPPTHNPDHNAFAAQLIDPAHGLPLTVNSRSCTCRISPQTVHDSGRECRIELRPRDHQLPGGIQLRFAMSMPPAHWADKFIAAGADRRWLTRTGMQRSTQTPR